LPKPADVLIISLDDSCFASVVGECALGTVAFFFNDAAPSE
jgi:hypothetical protein